METRTVETHNERTSAKRFRFLDIESLPLADYRPAETPELYEIFSPAEPSATNYPFTRLQSESERQSRWNFVKREMVELRRPLRLLAILSLLPLVIYFTVENLSLAGIAPQTKYYILYSFLMFTYASFTAIGTTGLYVVAKIARIFALDYQLDSGARLRDFFDRQPVSVLDRRSRQAGSVLVEVLIAAVIGVMISLAAAYVLKGTIMTTEDNDTKPVFVMDTTIALKK